MYILINNMNEFNKVRDGPLENLWGGRAKSKKNIRARENEMEKIRARQLTLKNIRAMG